MTRPLPIAPMIADMVRSGMARLDGTHFDDLPRCPNCNGEVRAHDTRQKRFATIANGAGIRDVHVQVKRGRCVSCGRLVYADAPFYPGTRHGIPVVELAATLGERMAPGRAAQTMARLGIVLDRGTVRKYAALALPPVPITELFGLPIPISVLRLAALVGVVPEAPPPPQRAIIVGRSPAPDGYLRGSLPAWVEERDER